jgi:DNA-binding response OmpR family regulator
MDTKKKILIIEDEAVLGELLLQKFNAEGYRAFWEVDGEAGLKKIRKIRPDMVLLDILMPKKDGYEVLEEIHKDKMLKNIPVVVISNSGQPTEVKRILELGVKDYIVKAQFNPTEVLDKVRRYVGNTGQVKEKKTTREKASNITVLIVEDDPFLSSIIAVRMGQEGYTVLLATDGEQAIELVEEKHPDLVLLDIVMPGLSGFDVLKAIKTNEHSKETLVVMFSNLGQEHEIEECKKLGAAAFLVKAKSTPREVLEKIQELLKERGKI